MDLARRLDEAIGNSLKRKDMLKFLELTGEGMGRSNQRREELINAILKNSVGFENVRNAGDFIRKVRERNARGDINPRREPESDTESEDLDLSSDDEFSRLTDRQRPKKYKIRYLPMPNDRDIWWLAERLNARLQNNLRWIPTNRRPAL